jgi:hypothetical protein
MNTWLSLMRREMAVQMSGYETAQATINYMVEGPNHTD